jgi:starvation-inducible outer membrane lipoprotein
MLIKKIEKGHYNYKYKRVEFDVIKHDDLEGELIWEIKFEEWRHEKIVYFDHGMDSLWATKGEALYMAKHFVNELILNLN